MHCNLRQQSQPNPPPAPPMLQKVILMLFHSHVVDCMWKKVSSSINVQHMIFAFFSTHLLLIYLILVLWVWHDKGGIESVQTTLRSKPQALVAIALFLFADIETDGWMWPGERRISRKSTICKWITDTNSHFF